MDVPIYSQKSLQTLLTLLKMENYIFSL